MPTFTGKTFSAFYNRIFQVSQTSNTGVDATTRNVQTGDGVNTSLSISDDVLQVQPQNDDTTGTMLVKNNAGNNILAVDTTNSKVLTGASQVATNTQYSHFGIDYGTPGLADDTHYAIPFNNDSTTSLAAMGTATTSSFNDTDPASSLTITSNAQLWVNCYWYIMDDITIDAVKWLHSADNATGSSTAAHMMAYSVVIDNSSTSGDLSGGVVVADGANITNAGHEQIYYQSMTIQSANVDAGKVVLFTFCYDDTETTDYAINATVKYHIR